MAQFDATSEAVTEDWLAIESPDAEFAVAIVPEPALFLFQDMAYSCIHSSPDFGALAPGETARARTRAYVAQSDLETGTIGIAQSSTGTKIESSAGQRSASEYDRGPRDTFRV